MDLYQVFITHNGAWTIQDIICLLALFILAAIFTCRQLCRQRIVMSQAVAGLALFLFIGVVFGSTVFTRMLAERKYNLELFWSWKEIINGNRDLLKENFLNCILLIPMGLLLPATLNHRISWWKGMLIGVTPSAIIETSQWIFCRGLFEWDDMIHNGIGCMIGCVIANMIKECLNKHKLQ